ncbi:MAG TPA: type VI secretion system baseplate subunit TssG, partial [Pirellulales bacterium]|nr:type VI secretion system baseplate subunit TssG [Pirellulales bacterium]
MAVSLGGKDTPVEGPPALEAQLRAEPYRFGFFQAVRILDRLLTGRKSVGHDAPPAAEVARFHAHLSMTFPPSELVDLALPADNDKPADITVAFLGLTGPSGALPRFYTELLLERDRAKDPTFRKFLDLFN